MIDKEQLHTAILIVNLLKSLHFPDNEFQKAFLIIYIMKKTMLGQTIMLWPKVVGQKNSRKQKYNDTDVFMGTRTTKHNHIMLRTN